MPVPLNEPNLLVGALVMTPDTLLFPVDQLSREMRGQVQASDGDYAITRPNSRTTARIVDGNAARLLGEFRQPTTIVQAVIRYCAANNEDPESTLEAAFPVFERLVQARLLVPPDAPETQRTGPTLEAGSRFAGATVFRCLQALPDTELYQVEASGGVMAALKVMGPAAHPETARMFDREAYVLRHLDATVTPAVLAAGTENGRSYLLLSWCHGADCALTAAHLRFSGDRAGLFRLSIAILDAYAYLHARNVIHSDVHPCNILVDDSYSVRIIDFGLARVTGLENEFRSDRAGVGYFLEPEYAKAALIGHRRPQSSTLGEQYALASLLHFLITGRHYLDFSLEKNEMLRQVAEDNPLPFGCRGLEPWPPLEEVIFKALAKDPAARFLSVADFAARLRFVVQPPTPVISSDPGPSSYANAREILAQVLQRLDLGSPLLRSGIAVGPRCSLTYGTAGVACALLRIACARQDPKILALADLWGERAVRDSQLDDAWYCSDIEITPNTVGRVSPFHTKSGVSFIKSLIAHAMADGQTQQSAIECFLTDVAASPCNNLDVTLGRSGILLAAAHILALQSHGSMVDGAALREFGSASMSSIWHVLDSYAPVSECREIDSTGIAHGWAGILYATLCWCRASGEPLPPNTTERLSQLAALSRHSGRHAKWSWTVGREPRGGVETFVGGWCNGTAGQVHLWLAAHSAINDDRYLILAERAAWHTFDWGTRIGSLCCGYAGQAYALLNLYRHTGDTAWRKRAQVLADNAALAYRDLPSNRDFEDLALRPDSLYKGALGVAVLAADIENPGAAAMPAFELIEF